MVLALQFLNLWILFPHGYPQVIPKAGWVFHNLERGQVTLAFSVDFWWAVETAIPTDDL